MLFYIKLLDKMRHVLGMYHTKFVVNQALNEFVNMLNGVSKQII